MVIVVTLTAMAWKGLTLPRRICAGPVFLAYLPSCEGVEIQMATKDSVCTCPAVADAFVNTCTYVIVNFANVEA